MHTNHRRRNKCGHGTHWMKDFSWKSWKRWKSKTRRHRTRMHIRNHKYDLVKMKYRNDLWWIIW